VAQIGSDTVAKCSTIDAADDADLKQRLPDSDWLTGFNPWWLASVI
jgi:hypothetical protein